MFCSFMVFINSQVHVSVNESTSRAAPVPGLARLIRLSDIYNSVNEKTVPIYFYTQYLSSWHFPITFLSHDRSANQYSLSLWNKKTLWNFRQEDVITIIMTWLQNISGVNRHRSRSWCIALHPQFSI